MTTNAGHAKPAPRTWSNPGLWQLAIAVTLCWSATFYYFPSHLLSWEQHFGWRRDHISYAYAIALGIAALTSIWIGRFIDRGQSKVLMVGSSLTAGILLLLLSQMQSLLHFYILWALIGMAMAGCLYEACFAFITLCYRTQTAKPVVMITLIAALAGPLSYSLSSFLIHHWGWQISTCVFAILALCLASTLFFSAVNRLEVKTKKSVVKQKVNHWNELKKLFANPIFWFLAVALGCMTLFHGMIISHIVPLIQSRGYDLKTTTIFASLIGLAQVASRISLWAFTSNKAMLVITKASVVAYLIAALFAYYADMNMAFLLFFVLLIGFGVGVQSVTKPIITAALLGRENFAFVSASVSTLHFWGYAVSPGLAGLLWVWAGYQRLLQVGLIINFIGLVCLAFAYLKHRTPYAH